MTDRPVKRKSAANLFVQFGNYSPMSRIGKNPIPIPAGVTISIDGQTVTVKGPKGELVHEAHRYISVSQKENELVCEIKHAGKESSALWGTTRAVLANLVTGVTAGFTKQLELHGVGFRGAIKGKNLELQVGFSHPVVVPAPEGITFTVEKEKITVEGPSAYLVGQVAANIRDIRPPEPYKGKGIRYMGEVVRRKVGKVVGTTA